MFPCCFFIDDDVFQIANLLQLRSLSQLKLASCCPSACQVYGIAFTKCFTVCNVSSWCPIIFLSFLYLFVCSGMSLESHILQTVQQSSVSDVSQCTYYVKIGFQWVRKPLIIQPENLPNFNLSMCEQHYVHSFRKMNYEYSILDRCTVFTKVYCNMSIIGSMGEGTFKDTNPLMSSLLVIFVWGGEAIWQVLSLVRNRV